MVGSVLMQRMQAENDFADISPVFFSTSQAGQVGPEVGGGGPLSDAFDVGALADCEVLLSCQGGDYTLNAHPQLRAAGWEGIWIDAASALRMNADAVIVLDPVNRALIDAALARGVKDFIGGNCTVSLMLMAAHALFENGWVEWLSAMTYQSASGAGARNMQELVQQMQQLVVDLDPADPALSLEQALTDRLREPELTTSAFGAPLAASLIPWIDRAVEAGQTREEWKGGSETSKILGLDPAIPVDGICVRVAAMRCHSQALTFKLTRDIPQEEIEAAIRESNAWVELVPNEKEATVQQLTPAAVTGSLQVPIGRLRKLQMGGEYLGAFTVGDQLLWGAAEPVRRMLQIVLGRL